MHEVPLERGPWSWLGFYPHRVGIKGQRGSLRGSTSAVFRAPAGGSFGFYYISLKKKKVFNQQESVKQALWCNNSACFVINIPRQS